MGFNWIFAIVAGVIILLIAIYAASQFIVTQEEVLYTETAAKLISLLDPLETGLASGKSTEIGFQKQTRLFFDCNEIQNEPFGWQGISFTEKTFGEEFGEVGGRVAIRDKYVFAESMLEGKRVVLFSKPFFMPFKISDLVIIMSDDYCVYNAPDEFKEDVQDLNLNNVKFPNASEECKGREICFESKHCEVYVNTKDNYVQREEKKLYYEGDLIYAAVFSSSEIYECNIKRLMNKLNELSDIYFDKITIIERKECKSNTGPKLTALKAGASSLKDSRDIIALYTLSEEIDSINEGVRSGCRLYRNVQ